MAEPRGGGSAAIERVARWFWTQGAARVGPFFAAATIVLLLVFAVWPATLTWSLYYGLDLRDTVLFTASATGLLVFLAPGFLYFLLARPVEAVRRWAAGDRSEPDLVVEAVYVGLREAMDRLAVLLTIIGTATMGPVAMALADGGVEVLVWLAVALGVLFQWARMVLSGAFELLVRPIREELVVDETSLAERSSPPVLRQMVTAAFLAAWATGVTAAAVVIQFDTTTARFAAGVVIPIALGTLYAVVVAAQAVIEPTLRPLADLRAGTERVAVGDVGTPIPVTSSDDLGRLVASFNDMQRGLAERARLHAAFGSYVDPALAERLLGQTGEHFVGESVDVTVLFADVRDFTSYADAHTAEESVERLNRLFRLVVPVLRAHQGHANKFLGDGVMAVFGAPEPVADHADRALEAAVAIQEIVAETFGEGMRIGIGVNSGRVIAGTIGGGGKLEFTLIGDAVNVAARVEELTKELGAPILVTAATVDSLVSRPPGLRPSGRFEIRGKPEPVEIHALDPFQRTV